VRGRERTALRVVAGVVAGLAGAVAVLAVAGIGPFSDDDQAFAGLPGPPGCAPDPGVAGAGGGTDEALIARRLDGRLPLGFNDGAYLAGQATATDSAALQRAAGSTIWRSVAQWQAMEPAPGTYDFSSTDPVYCAALAAGIAPLFHITTTPPWAADPAFPCEPRCGSPPLAEHYDSLRRFAAALASRYPGAVAIEAWNEPNLHLFWERPDPARYVEVLREIHAGVKAVDPEMPVLLGGLSPVPADDPQSGDIALDRFLRDAYAAGAADYVDAVNVHVYPSAPGEDPRQVLARILGATREATAAAGVGPQRIWITELGVPAGPETTRERQADELETYYRELGRAGDVDAALIHTMVEPNSLIIGGDGFGWVAERDAAGAFLPHPVFCRFAALLAEPLDCAAPVPIG
jgi:hypothetical protein